MKKEPIKVFIHKNGTYVELSHERFCELKESDSEYQDKKFIMLHQMLLEVSEIDHQNFYRNKRRQKYLSERAKKGRDVSAEQPIKDKGDLEYKLEDIVEDINQDLAGQAERNIMLDRLIDCLDHLSTEEIYVLYLRFDEERTEEEIGQVFNISQQAVSKRIFKILGKLNKLLMQ